MRINISKKMIGLVTLPILFICIIVGIISTNLIKQNITDEIEIQLKTGAYSISQTLKLRTSEEDINNDIKNLYDYTNIDVTIFQGKERIASTIDGAVGTKMDNHIYEELQTGKDYFTVDANVNGQSYFGYYIPFFIEDEFGGATFTGVPQSDANATIIQSIIKIIGCIIICGILSVIVAVILVKKIVGNINQLQNTIGTLLENDLSKKYTRYETEHDEMEELSNKTIDFSEQLNHIIKKIKNASTELKDIALDLKNNTQFTNDTCNQISQAIENIASGAVSQAEDTSNAAIQINNMSEELGNIKNNANNLRSIANSMNTAKGTTLNTLTDLQKVNETIVSEVNSTSNQVNETSESVEQIKKAVAMIQDITEQTKLLSLNASIEAAHAGEHGKGFAIVAEEISKLANQSAQSSNEIESILKQLVKNYDIIIENVKDITKNMFFQNEKLSETQNVFSILETDINETVGRIIDINTMVENLDKEIRTMVDVISDLSAISEENSASTEQTMASIEEMNATITHVYEKAQNVDKSANELMQEVNIFKTV